MSKKRPSEEQIERSQVEEVFNLQGELNDAPGWVVTDTSGEDRSFRFAYSGAPIYAENDHAEGMHATAVVQELYGTAPDVVVDTEGARWIRVATYSSSGERECPFRDWDPNKNWDGRERKVTRQHAFLTPKRELRLERPRWYGDKRPNNRQSECIACGERVGQPHGFIYLGDGWTEVVYKREEPRHADCKCEEPCETWDCLTCNRTRPYCDGGEGDECDDCWVKTQTQKMHEKEVDP